jgi:hypothetical protein
MAIRLHLVPGREPADLLQLPWSVPLRRWPAELMVRMAHGASRHVVRFVRQGEAVHAFKEMAASEAEHEYRMLRELSAEGLPVVAAVGLVTGRVDEEGREIDAVLMTRYLDYSLPYHYLFGVEAGQNLAHRLVDAAVVLMARLHLEGFYWGDCSLSNLLFRRDAGALMAYLVDAETAERHTLLGDEMREHDMAIAVENLVGGLLDLQAAGKLGPEIDAYELGAMLGDRYGRLWVELTGVVELDVADQHLIESRLRRLTDLGFDIGELLVEQTDETRLRVRPALLEEGHHARELRRLTGLEIQENQARRLLNDIATYGAYLSSTEAGDVPMGMAAARWLVDVYGPVVAAVPDELSNRLEPAELFHEFLEHRYHLAESQGEEVDNAAALRSYVDDVLRFRPAERLVISDTDAG